MSEPEDKIKEKQSYLSIMESMHPHKVLLLFALFGSSVILLSLVGLFSFSYFTASREFNLIVPKAFVFSTLLILPSSFIITRATSAFEKENDLDYRRVLGTVLLLGFLFIMAQYIGWEQLYTSGISLQGQPAGAFLYVITGFHGLHVIFAMIFLTHIFRKAQALSKDPIKRLIITTTPYEKIKLEMAIMVWHFLDISWVLLFIFFLLVI